MDSEKSHYFCGIDSIKVKNVRFYSSEFFYLSKRGCHLLVITYCLRCSAK